MKCKYCGKEIQKSEFQNFFTVEALESMPCSPECKQTQLKLNKFKNLSTAEHTLIGCYYNANNNKQFEVLLTSENRDEVIEKFNSIDVENTKYSHLQVLAPQEETD